MGIRPVDMQVVVQNSSQVDHQKHSDYHRQDVALPQSQLETKETAEKQQQQVNKSEETKGERIKDDENSKQSNYRGKTFKDKEKKDDEDEEKDKVISTLGSHFDMKV